MDNNRPEKDGSVDERQTRTLRSGTINRLTPMLRASRWAFFALVPPALFSMGHWAGAVQKEQDMLEAGVISADKYQLLSPDGKIGAELSTGQVGWPMLTFFDRTGTDRLAVGIDMNGSPSISFSGGREAGGLNMKLSLSDASGGPLFSMFDERGRAVITLGATKGMGANVTVGEARGSRVSIDISKDGSPSIYLVDSKNDPRIVLQVLPDVGPVIFVKGPGGIVRASWRVLADGSPCFSLLDPNKNERLRILTDKDGKPAIQFLDQGGRVLEEINEVQPPVKVTGVRERGHP